MSSVRPSNSGRTRIVGSVRDARGAAESISSYLSALPTIRVCPELDGRTLDIVHSLSIVNCSFHIFHAAPRASLTRPTIRVRPELDGRTLDIVHSLSIANCSFHILCCINCCIYYSLLKIF